MKHVKRNSLLAILLTLLFCCFLGFTSCSRKSEEKNPSSQNKQNTDTSSEKESPNTDNNSTEETQTDPDSSSAPAQTEPVEPDMSGDYIGDLICPLPPANGPYRLIHNSDLSNVLLLHIENIDDGNFHFNITQANLKEDGTYTEEPIFLEHTAHYNGDGYYEYIGQDYHLYFKYSDLGRVVSDKTVEVYGLEKLYNPSDYHDVLQYEDMTGNAFHMGLPGAG